MCNERSAKKIFKRASKFVIEARVGQIVLERPCDACRAALVLHLMNRKARNITVLSSSPVPTVRTSAADRLWFSSGSLSEHGFGLAVQERAESLSFQISSHNLGIGT